MATAFDTILRSYGGYTDETILDLTLGRIRQMVRTIERREFVEQRARSRFELDVAEGIARSVVAGLAPLAMSGDAAKLVLRNAQEIELRKRKKKQSGGRRIPTIAEVSKVFGIGGNNLAGVKSG